MESSNISEDLSEDFNIVKCLGRGSFGTVYQIYENQKNKFYAIKIFEKSKHEINLVQVEKEASIMKTLNHPNIIKFIKFFTGYHYFGISMEFMEGGDLDKVMKQKTFNHQEIKIIMKSIIKGISYFHDKRIIHRDLKPSFTLLQLENLLFAKKDDYSCCKIADFGLAIKMDALLVRKCGTPIYVAPEIITSGVYSKPVDMWACGIILYQLFCGEHPFHNKMLTIEDYFKKIKSGKLDMELDSEIFPKFYCQYYKGTAEI